MAGNNAAQSVHLRTACDPCSTAKVRCDKKHPACGRCAQFKLQCSYSHSRRHGRRTTLRKRPGYRRIGIFNTSTAAEDTAITTAVPIAPAVPLLTPASYNTLPPSTTLSIGGYHPTGSVTTGEVGLNDPSLLSTWSFGDDAAANGIDVGAFADWEIPDLPLLEPASSGTAYSTLTPLEKRSPASNVVSKHDCEAQAILILRSMQHGELHEGATSCATHPVQYAELNLRPSFDRVLATNKAALDGCARLMECSCALCPHIILLHVSILSKVLFWYRIAASNETDVPRSSQSQNSVSAGSLSPEDPPTPAQFSVAPTEVQVGMLDLNAEDEASLRRMLLLRELYRTRKVVNELMNVDRTALEKGDDLVRSSVEWSLGGIARVKEALGDVIEKMEQVG
ncbi:hypothetical protein NPX13_g7854 [Xylaria arbuscula]|uniref:Zn(2)-C6 fungal-type domain-containing protein n=1 Tax=Xylaria arbuscula TaxID=114810 RepID=A0A9W8N992_9PEZI|nr:hypothetical protein NPX13_g7854 [Xylaria arbuscula]